VPSLVSAAPTESTIYDLPGYKQGGTPLGSILQDSSGALYGTASDIYPVSPNDYGTIFKLTPPAPGAKAWTFSLLYSFQGGADGRNPNSGLVPDQNGNLFGTMPSGVFELSPPSAGGTTWTLSVIANIANVALGGVLRQQDGSLIGVSSGTESDCSVPGNCGSVFMLTPPTTGQTAWTQTTLYYFKGGVGDGAYPLAAPIPDGHGNLIGTTSEGGPPGGGTVFELSPPGPGQTAWTETVLYAFQGNGAANTDGRNPEGSLVGDGTGALYGTTRNGGATDSGTVFMLSPPSAPGSVWTETQLHQFELSGGAYPLAALTPAKSGVMFGTTSTGSAGGTLFRLLPPSAKSEKWRFANVWTFSLSGPTVPVANLLLTASGELIGTGELGGKTGCAVINHGEKITCGGVFEVKP
jgi:uncharacterized repeat protein (TIGR03803 family)